VEEDSDEEYWSYMRKKKGKKDSEKARRDHTEMQPRSRGDRAACFY